MAMSPICVSRSARRGMSMAEVLVALFILALGVVAILTLFPVGMLQIGQALKDDRTAQCAAQADAYMRAYWKQYALSGSDSSMAYGTGAFDNPTGLPTPQAFQAPSFPVFFDPIGCVGSAANTSNVAGLPGVPRRNLAIIGANPALSLRTCSLMDGMSYDTSGFPTTDGGSIDRELRYNWLWVLQRPQGTQPGEQTATMTIVVFDHRLFLFPPANTEVAFTPVANGNGVLGSTSVSFNSGTQLGVQKGGWIADLSVVPAAGVMNANFYRVVSVTDNGVTVDVELQTPIQDTSGVGGTLPATSRTFVVLAGVSEVFVRPNLESQ